MHVLSPRVAAHALLLARHAFASARVTRESDVVAIGVARTALSLCTLSFKVCLFQSELSIFQPSVLGMAPACSNEI